MSVVGRALCQLSSTALTGAASDRIALPRCSGAVTVPGNSGSQRLLGGSSKTRIGLTKTGRVFLPSQPTFQAPVAPRWLHIQKETPAIKDFARPVLQPFRANGGRDEFLETVGLTRFLLRVQTMPQYRPAR